MTVAEVSRVRVTSGKLVGGVEVRGCMAVWLNIGI